MVGKTRRPRVTMRDVARRAAVSQSTVSLVVNNVPIVAPETRERVNRAIEELGFRANRSARNLRGSPNQTIGFVTDQMVTSPFAGQTIYGAQDVAWKHGHVLLVVDAGDSAELTDTAVNVLIDQDVAGIIYALMTPKSISIPAALRDVPSIIVNADPSSIRDFPLVEAGNYDGGVLAARTLVEYGHRSILYLAGQQDNPVTIERERGFRSVLATLPSDAVEFEVSYGTYDISSGYRRMRARIESHAWWPSAIFAANDRVALGAIQALSEAGRQVPAEISVLGYDDQPSLAAEVHPALTTITLPHFEMGQLAVEALLDQIHSGRSSRPLVAHPQLILRESIRAVGQPLEFPNDPRNADPPFGQKAAPPDRKSRQRHSAASRSKH